MYSTATVPSVVLVRLGAYELLKAISDMSINKIVVRSSLPTSCPHTQFTARHLSPTGSLSLRLYALRTSAQFKPWTFGFDPNMTD